MKRITPRPGEEVFYVCTPCDSVRHPFHDEEIDLAVTAKERSSFDERQYISVF